MKRSKRAIYTKTPLQFTDFGEELVGEVLTNIIHFTTKWEGRGVKPDVLRLVVKQALKEYLSQTTIGLVR